MIEGNKNMIAVELRGVHRVLLYTSGTLNCTSAGPLWREKKKKEKNDPRTRAWTHHSNDRTDPPTHNPVLQQYSST